MLTILQGDWIERLRELPDRSVHCVVTSPPYWGLRDYGVEGQLGLEKTPEEYVARMLAGFRQVRRVLRDDGTLWLNLGDSYYNYRTGYNGALNKQSFHKGPNGKPVDHEQGIARRSLKQDGLKEKDLCGIPWRVAFALQQPYMVPTCVKSEIDRAWLAAMFDGEGCIGIRRFDSYRKEKQQVYQDGFVVYTTVTNNDVALLEKCIAITGFGSTRIKQRAGDTDHRMIVSRRDSYGWRLDGNNAVDIIRAIYPYLIAKRKQACIAYTLDQLNKSGHGSRAVPAEIQDKKVMLWGLIKACNQRRTVDLPDWILEPKQLVEPGWYLRSDIIWAKPNPMPESVTDRPTKAHEYIFLLSKSQRYFYDAEAIKEQSITDDNRRPYTSEGAKQLDGRDNWHSGEPRNGDAFTTRNKRTVWTVATAPYSEAHFATFPPDLIKPCILAGTSARGCCPKCGAPWERMLEEAGRIQTGGTTARTKALGIGHGNGGNSMLLDGAVSQYKTTGWNPTCDCLETGREIADLAGQPSDNSAFHPIPCTVLDPFGGSGTTGQVALELGRSAILIELNPAYVKLAEKRTNVTPGLALA